MLKIGFIKVFKGSTDAGNTRFINRAMQKGWKIFDIGPDFGRRMDRLSKGINPAGHGYNLERQLTVGYQKVIKLWQRTGKFSGDSLF